MKAHLAKVSLALLSTVFLLGCQDMGSGPVGPDGPQFDMRDAETEASCGLLVGKVFKNGHCHGGAEPTPAATFTVLHVGDVTTIPSPITDGRPGLGKKGTSVTFGGVYSTDQIVLSDDFVTNQSLPPFDRSACFPGGQGGVRAFGGGIRGGFRQGKGSNEVTGQYVFEALGIDGSALWYSIELTGTFTTSVSGAALAPASGESTNVTWNTGGHQMHVNNDADERGCVGGGGKHSAQKNVEINGSVEIVGDPVP